MYPLYKVSTFMWSGRGDSLVAYPHFFGVLATSICNNLPYRFRLLVHNFLGIIFVDQKKEKKSIFLWLRCRWDSAICSVFELFWCFWVVFRDFVFGYLRVFTGSRNLIFNSTWCLQIHYDRLGKDGLFRRIAKKRSLVWNPVMGFLELRKMLMGMK